jgi:glutathione gamma-glutamylcysteinyltransferase
MAPRPAAALRLSGSLPRRRACTDVPNGRRLERFATTCSAGTASLLLSTRRREEHPQTQGAARRVFKSTAAAAATRRTSFDDSYGGEGGDYNEHTEQECLWLSSRHCQTCSCPDDATSATVPSSSTTAESNAPPPGTVPLSRPKVADVRNQQETALASSQGPGETETSGNPLAARLLQLMSAPSAAAAAVLQPPVPAYSVRRRVLPRSLTSLNSPRGQDYLVQALVGKTAASYLPLTLHFANQSDPAFCGITTLLVVLNGMSIDPHTRWKGGWRYFGDEESLLGRCCLSVDHVKAHGITVDEFCRLASCQGLRVRMKRATRNRATRNTSSVNGADINGVSNALSPSRSMGSLDDFRRDVVSVLTRSPTPTDRSKDGTATLVVSFGRSGLQQTGDGHFSPLAAYHSDTDQVLVLDVARFKYPPYWVPVRELYEAMTLPDEATQLPRGWFVLEKPSSSLRRRRWQRAAHGEQHEEDTLCPDDSDGGVGDNVGEGEDRRPAHLVPTQKEASWCPMHKAKIEYCRNATTKSGGSSGGSGSGTGGSGRRPVVNDASAYET